MASGFMASGGWYPERWTLDGPEPYAVPLAGTQPEEADSELLPLADGRVLIRRRVADRYAFSLLYPTGPQTGELPLGSVECPWLTLLPPAPGGSAVYALAPGERSTAVWLVCGGTFGPEHIAEIRGRCSGGAWLDRTGRMLALDRELEGRTKTVAVDLRRGGEVTPLLQIAEHSNDRLLLADPDSGLLLVHSDAPGHDRFGWGVLGSQRPVRFPEGLLPEDGTSMVPFAVQPGQDLMPERCAVALRVDGAQGSWASVWRPSDRRSNPVATPPGWLAGAGLWTREGQLLLPYATAQTPCGLARVRPPEAACDLDTGGIPHASASRRRPGGAGRSRTSSDSSVTSVTSITSITGMESATATSSSVPGQPEEEGDERTLVLRPVPLQQAPLTQAR
ncbi:hypothetical protein [Streptomyces sp. H27-D2]|uniref:hypothetical protein n=1 Tax=Streptomyces sp. H27-D2 TaxID=3046304 RepID=UPI003FA77ACE